MTAPFAQIFVRGILANWLVCLALWTAARASGDGAKLVLIFWCLFAFVTSGYEHSIANMSLLSLALFIPHPGAVTWAGFVNNLVPSTLGNMVGGGIGVGALYWLTLPENGRLLARSAEPALARAGVEAVRESR
jgi:nitrite transporter NirC